MMHEIGVCIYGKRKEKKAGVDRHLKYGGQIKTTNFIE